MSDGAYLPLNSGVNRQNVWYWGAKNPCEIHESALYSLQVMVWCTVSIFKIIDSYFAETGYDKRRISHCRRLL
jgi:hypothetical protein